MTPYLSFLLSPFIELSKGSDDEDLIGQAQLSVVQTLTKSLNVDEGGPYRTPLLPPTTTTDTIHIFPPKKTAFWRDDRLQQVLPVLVALVAPAGVAAANQDASSPSSSPGVVVSASLVALCGAATDDGLLKKLNLDVLLHTRAEDVRVRIVALRCARALWTAHGSKLIGACRGVVDNVPAY